MENLELANRIFDFISDGYDDEEHRETTVNQLCEELSETEDDSAIKCALIALCDKIEELEM